MKLAIGFSTANLPLAKLIQDVEKRPYSHVFVVIPDPITQRPLVAQASHGMVHLCSYEGFEAVNKIVKTYEYEIDYPTYKKVWNQILDWLGAAYSIKQLIGLLVQKIFQLPTIPSWATNGCNAQICSEFGARVASLIGIQINKDFDDITPSNLDAILGAQK